MIRLYLKVLEEFERLFLQGRFWVMHIPFVRMVNFHSLAEFPVVSSLITFLTALAVKGFRRNLTDSKSPWISRILLSSLNGLDSASDFQFLQSSFQACGTVPSTPTTICTSDTFILHSLFSSRARSKHLSIFF